MKQVIEGKMYNTETATKIADYQYSHRGDFNWFVETLYQTKKGNWFIAGEGGANTHYKIRSGEGFQGSECIDPLTRKEVLEWCERNRIDADIVEQYFDIEEA